MLNLRFGWVFWRFMWIWYDKTTIFVLNILLWLVEKISYSHISLYMEWWNLYENCRGKVSTFSKLLIFFGNKDRRIPCLILLQSYSFFHFIFCWFFFFPFRFLYKAIKKRTGSNNTHTKRYIRFNSISFLCRVILTFSVFKLLHYQPHKQKRG